MKQECAQKKGKCGKYEKMVESTGRSGRRKVWVVVEIDTS
jgi:hypothetical protein